MPIGGGAGRSMINVPTPSTIITLLEATGRGEVSARQDVLPLIYDELRMVTARAIKRSGPGQAIPVTTLAKEAMVRLLGDLAASPTNRARFVAIAAGALREIVVEQAYMRRNAHTAEADDNQSRPVDVLALDGALNRLARIDARQARIVELRFFGGLSIEDTALALGISPDMATCDWLVARAWLFREVAIAS